jgi:hypothetical protein
VKAKIGSLGNEVEKGEGQLFIDFTHLMYKFQGMDDGMNEWGKDRAPNLSPLRLG